jgi:hypothetical protein
MEAEAEGEGMEVVQQEEEAEQSQDPPVKVPPTVCASCNCSFNAKKGLAGTKRFICKGKPNQKGVRAETSVAMWKALVEIFDQKSLGIWRRSGCELEFNKDLVLCQVCGIAVARLYEAMKKFRELNKKDSYISQVTSQVADEFVKLVNDTEEFGGEQNPDAGLDTESSQTNPMEYLETDMRVALTGMRKSPRTPVPKKFVYEGTIAIVNEDEGEGQDEADPDYYPPGAYDTSKTEEEQVLDYYAYSQNEDPLSSKLSLHCS